MAGRITYFRQLCRVSYQLFMKDVVRFLLHPTITPNRSTLQKLRYFLKGLFFVGLVSFVRSVIIGIENVLTHQTDYHPLFLGIAQHYQTTNPSGANTYRLLVIALYALVLEELVFRAGLTFRRYGLGLMLSGVYFAITTEFIVARDVLNPTVGCATSGSYRLSVMLSYS